MSSEYNIQYSEVSSECIAGCRIPNFTTGSGFKRVCVPDLSGLQFENSRA